MQLDRIRTSPLTYLIGGYNWQVAGNVRDDIGNMLTPQEGSARLVCSWTTHGLDNGCYSKVVPFNALKWHAWVNSHRKYAGAGCLFAVAPDVVGDAYKTFNRSLVWLPVLRMMGYKAAYVTQDGLTDTLLPWDWFDVLFVGGTNAWKLSDASWAIVREAKRRGKRVHVGRVNTLERLRLCATNGVDSVDGNMMKYASDRNWWKLVDMLDTLREEYQHDA